MAGSNFDFELGALFADEPRTKLAELSAHGTKHKELSTKHELLVKTD